MMNASVKQYFEMNTTNVQKDSTVAPMRKDSAIVETMSAIVRGIELNEVVRKHGQEKVNRSVGHIKDLGNRASTGDGVAKFELNTIQRYVVDALLLSPIQLFSFMGKFHDIGFDVQAKVKVPKHESVRSTFQASQGDVNFAMTSHEEYVVNTQTISAGYAVNYREVASGNLDRVAEGMEQVKIDMMNKSMQYVILTIYNAIKNATGVKYFAEAAGITKTSVDDVIKKVRRWGRPSLMGDYSVTSQLNNFAGVASTTPNISRLSEAVGEEIRNTGLLTAYNGAAVIELPNSYNISKLNTAGDNFKTYLPEGLLFTVPQGVDAPINIFRRGGITSAQAMDIVSGMEITRFDTEIGADLAKGREFTIGLLSDSAFEAPSLNF